MSTALPTAMSTDLEDLPTRYLRADDAARFVGLSVFTLQKHRIYGTGPRYSKVGGRVFYRLADLQAWVDSAARSSTSDSGKAVVLPAKPWARAELEQARQPRH